MPKLDLTTHNVLERGGASKQSRLVQMAFGEAAPQSVDRTTMKIVDIPIEQITPRPINNYRQYRIDNLAKSIRNTNNTLIHPIVVVKPQDLPADHEVITKFKQQGIDISSLQYVVVAGERRFRAWNQLWKEEQEHPTNEDYPNPFNKISARVLTKEEAKDEVTYYAESNDEARQISALEGLLHIKSVIKEVETDEQKRNAVLQMKEAGYDGYADMDVPADIVKAARKFNQAKFCHYYFTEELGIDNWSFESIKKDLFVFNNCCDAVIDAILKDGFKITNARQLTNLEKNRDANFDLQRKLIHIWKEDGQKAFDSALEKILSSKKKGDTAKHISYKDAKKSVDSIISKIKHEKLDFMELAKKLGPSEQATAKKIIKKLDVCMAEIAEISKEYLD